MRGERLKILFLSAWYPTEKDAMAGLFVQKHAEAVAEQGVDVQVIYSDATGLQWVKEIIRQWRKLKRSWGVPDLVQMNVLDKNGLLAQWLFHRYHIPYIIIEHWSGYLPANFAFRGGWHGKIMKKIAQQAACILPVSKMLEQAMKQCGIQNEHWHTIHNVVDDYFYQTISPSTLPPRQTNKTRILHVSCFDERAKNIQGMLRAVRAVADLRQDFELIIIGTGIDYEQDVAYAHSLQFPDGSIHFLGEQPPYKVAEWMQQSDFFLFFSRYENAPVVLSEGLAVGLPIVTSNAGGIPEMVSENEGILVPVGDEEALSAAIVQMMDNKTNYSKQHIQEKGKIYNYQQVGQMLVKVYRDCLGV